MPTVRLDPRFRFFFYSDEGTEPPHVHIEAAERRAKFWLRPVVLEWNDGFRSGDLKTIQRILEANESLLIGEWNAFFSV